MFYEKFTLLCKTLYSIADVLLYCILFKGYYTCNYGDRHNIEQRQPVTSSYSTLNFKMKR